MLSPFFFLDGSRCSCLPRGYCLWYFYLWSAHLSLCSLFVKNQKGKGREREGGEESTHPCKHVKDRKWVVNVPLGFALHQLQWAATERWSVAENLWAQISSTASFLFSHRLKHIYHSRADEVHLKSGFVSDVLNVRSDLGPLTKPFTLLCYQQGPPHAAVHLLQFKTIFISEHQSRPRAIRFSSCEGGVLYDPWPSSGGSLDSLQCIAVLNSTAFWSWSGFDARQRRNHQFLDYSKHSFQSKLFYYKMRTTETSVFLMLCSICCCYVQLAGEMRHRDGNIKKVTSHNSE